ncbi:MAG: hypothetical protein JWO44_1004 [Bacteroidetes bacterium]|nr:hypothetical protein [Bacteroidota bacterium]
MRRNWGSIVIEFKIHKFKNMELKDIITIAGITLTFIIGLTGLVISLLNSKKTIFINSVTASRTKWIETVRNSISEFCGLTLYLSITPLRDSERNEIIQKINRLRFIINLQLNRNDSFDKRLIKNIDMIVDLTNSTQLQEPEKETIKNKIIELVSLTQDLLKLEWEGVKEETKKGNLTKREKNVLLDKYLNQNSINMDQSPTRPSNDQLIINYMILRKIVGLLGIALPFILLFYSLIMKEGLQISISHYYHTDMRNIFVGTLCMVSVFLYSYKGFDHRDKITSRLACIFGLGVAFFPTTFKTIGNCEASTNFIGYIHLACACGFFLSLTYYSLFLFTESDKKKTEQTLEKRIRNIIYKICGSVMLICVVVIILYLFLPGLRCRFYHLKPVFWSEAVALWAFGFSWFVKGEAILKD